MIVTLDFPKADDSAEKDTSRSVLFLGILRESNGNFGARAIATRSPEMWTLLVQ
jgi:hypothetical protein